MAQRAPTSQASVGEIIQDLADNAQTLVRQQVALAKAEILENVTAQVKGRALGAMLLATGGILTLLALAFLGVTLILALQSWFALAGWLAALIVTLVYLLLGGLLAFAGKRALESEEIDELGKSL